MMALGRCVRAAALSAVAESARALAACGRSSRALAACASVAARAEDDGTRAGAVRAAARLCAPPGDARQALELAQALVGDPHPRVRRAALEAALELGEQGAQLPAQMYARAAALLADTEEAVRAAAVGLVLALCLAHPNHAVSPADRSRPAQAAAQAAGGGGRTVDAAVGLVRLVDDAFIRVCAVVSADASPRVRARACEAIGRMAAAAPALQQQALSKKLLVAQGGRQKRRRELPPSVTPEGDMDVSGSLGDLGTLESSAAGALVHGLEDEAADVRVAAIRAIRSLCAAGGQAFGDRASEYLVDMFNDETDRVRLAAVRALVELGGSVGAAHLQQEQLHTVLSVLGEAAPAVRVAVHGMLAGVALPNATCTHATIQALLGSLTRWPEDKPSVFSSLSNLGKNHPKHIAEIIKDLFQLDPRFTPVEANADNDHYAGCAIAAYNAAMSDQSILSLLPKYCLSHIQYLKDKYPEYVPGELADRSWEFATDDEGDADAAPRAATDRDGDTAMADASAGPSSLSSLSQSSGGIRSFFEETLKLLSRAPGLARQGRDKEVAHAMRVAARDLRRIASLSPQMRPRARLCLLLLKCLGMVTSSPSSPRPEFARACERLIYMAMSSEARFSGLRPYLLTRLVLVRLWAHAGAVSCGSALAAETFGARQQAAKTFLEDHGADLSYWPLLQALVTAGPETVSQGDFIAVSAVQLSEYLCTGLSELVGDKSLSEVSVEIEAPQATSLEHPTEFSASFPLALQFTARVEGFSAPLDSLLLEVVFPDGTSTLVPVFERCIAEENDAQQPYTRRLRIDMPFAVHWADRPYELSCLSLRLVQGVVPDAPFPQLVAPRIHSPANPGGLATVPLKKMHLFVQPKVR
eukprot:m51a1_g2276 hypothetical protein (869) ;mRNA; f:373687-376901